jgi:hypothetical protein
LVEKADSLYFAALDYQFLAVKCLRYANEFLNKGDISKADKYVAKAEKYYRLALALRRDSQTVLDGTYSAAQWTVAYEASKRALGFAVAPLGPVASILNDTGSLWTDYLLDSSSIPVEEARKNLLLNTISTFLFRDLKESVGDNLKHTWGSSGVYSKVREIMGSSAFKDKVLKEFMRLGGRAGEYAAEQVVDEVWTRLANSAVDAIVGAPPDGEGRLAPSGQNVQSVTAQAKRELSWEGTGNVAHNDKPPDTAAKPKAVTTQDAKGPSILQAKSPATEAAKPQVTPSGSVGSTSTTAKQQSPTDAKSESEAKPRELTPAEKAAAAKLWERVETAKKTTNAPLVGEISKKRMVDLCRQAIRQYPDSEYASKAKQALASLPEKDRKRFGVTDQETGTQKK